MSSRRPRNSRTWWIRWLVASLVFMQLASAAYACATGTAGIDARSMAGMPCVQATADALAPALDPEQPGLCFEHCKGGSQALDQTAPAPLPLPALLALYIVPVAADASAESRAWRQAQQRSRGSAPPQPHSILHCCYRI